MKIRTVIHNTDHVQQFDAEVNALIEEGWGLAKRAVLSGQQYNENNWARRALYAELVLLEEQDLQDEPAPAPAMTWEEAVHVLKATCRGAKQCGPECPVYHWCSENLPDNFPPSGWSTPEEVAAE